MDVNSILCFQTRSKDDANALYIFDYLYVIIDIPLDSCDSIVELFNSKPVSDM